MKNILSQQSKRVSIVAGGEMNRLLIPQITTASVIIGVDRGALWLLGEEIVPSVAIGDFDSVSKAEFAEISQKIPQIIRHPKEKDETDLELAVEHARGYKPIAVTMFGVLGGRFDHTQAAIGMLLRLASYNIKGQIVDKSNKIHIVRHQEKFSRVQCYRFLSIVPIGASATVSISGVKYPVTNKKFFVHKTLGISNEITSASATVFVHSGSALVIQSRDYPEALHRV